MAGNANNDGDVIYVIRADDSKLEKDLDAADKKVKKSLEKSANDTLKIEDEKNEKIADSSEKSAKKVVESAKDTGKAWEDAAETAEKAVDDLGEALDEIQSTDIQIDADTSQAMSEINNLQVDDIEVNVDADASKAESEIHSISDDKTIDINVDADVSQAESRIKDVSDDKSIKVKVEADVSDAEEAIKGLDDAAEKTGGNISKLLGNAFGAAKDSAGETLSAMGPLGAAASGLTAGLSGTAVAAVGAGAAVVGIGAAAVGVSNDIDKAMNQLQASTGASAEETEKYQEVLEGIYKNNYGEDFNDISEAIALVKKNMGDMSGEEMQEISESAFTLRDVFEYDIQESTRAAKAMMDNFGISGEDAMNLIAAGAQNGLDYSGEFLDSLSEYSVQFSKMGFSADDMFNIFQKGTDTGAFNLDKIGDAVKENAIRVIDCSDSTAEAFQKLGLASEDLSEPMSEAQEEAAKYSDKIEDLKDKLELAKVKQSEFTDKTSESTKLSNEQTIEKYTEDLAEAEAELGEINSSIDSMNAQMQNSGPSVEEFAQKFAAGGETAQEAFDQVMTGIMALEDPLEQNAVGTALFGTMWEDLGPEVVGALGEIGEAAYGTGEELENMKDAKYDDLGSSLEALKRNFELLLEPLGEALIPLLNELVQFLIPIAECIAPIIEAIAPLISLLADILVPIIGTVLSVVSEVFGGITELIGSSISRVLEILQNLISFVVNIFTGNWSAAWENVKNIFGNIFGGLADILKAPINFIIDILNGLIKGINSIQIPDWVPVIGGASANIPTIPRLKVGMDYVPSDDFPALLHEGEAVLTKQENAAYRQLGGVAGMTDMLNTPDYKSYADPFGTINFDYEKLANIVGKSNGDIILTMNGNELMRWIREENESYRIRTDGVGYLD